MYILICKKESINNNNKGAMEKVRKNKFFLFDKETPYFCVNIFTTHSEQT